MQKSLLTDSLPHNHDLCEKEYKLLAIYCHKCSLHYEITVNYCICLGTFLEFCKNTHFGHTLF